MSEQSELNARIEALEKRVKYLEDTFATLADMNKSGKMGQYIAQRQRALAASKLVNAAAGSQKLNADAQQQVIDQLAAEKAAMDARIEEAIRAAEQNAPAEDDLAEQFTYCDFLDGVEIKTFNGFETNTELFIPNKIQGKYVIRIGNESFQGTHFKKIHLPDGLRYIGDNAFLDCKNLEIVLLPQNLQSIKSGAFRGCENLRNVMIPDRLKVLGGYAFANSGIQNISIPAEMKKIPDGCFYGCKYLKNIILSNALETIGANAFANTSIGKIVIPESVIKVEYNALIETKTYARMSRDNRKIDIAVLGKNTEIEEIPRTATIYCLPGSKVQIAARALGIPVKPLSEFRNI